MATTENLRPWKKGQSGNPSGRPHRDADIGAMIRADAAPMVKWLIEVGLGRVKKINAEFRAKAIFALLDRGFGRPRQTVEVSQQVPFVALLPAKIEDPDQWERQAEKVLATHGLGQPRVVEPEPVVNAAEEWANDVRRERRDGVTRRSAGVEFALEPEPPPDNSTPHAARRIRRR